MSDEIKNMLLMTNIVTICIYAVIFLSLFLIGYCLRAKNLYDHTKELLTEELASNAWYPVVSTMTMGKAADCKYVYSMIATILFIVCVPLMSVLMIADIMTSSVCFKIIIIFYLLYSTCHTIVLKKYMNKFYPETSDLCIIVSGYVPFLKYFVHV